MVDPKNGFLVHEQCEVDIASAMLKNAKCAIMAVDHSKFLPQDRRPALRQPPLKTNDILISNCNPPEQFDGLLQGMDRRIVDPQY